MLKLCCRCLCRLLYLFRSTRKIEIHNNVFGGLYGFEKLIQIIWLGDDGVHA